MATSTYLSNPGEVLIGAVNVTDQCTAVVFNYAFDVLENTAFGSLARTSVAGLQNNSATLTLYMSYAAAETYATLQPLVGTQVTLQVKPSTGAESATNPIQILTGGLLGALPVINASLGELSTVDIEITGGVYSVDATPPA
jgi:hypothetical protein